MNLFRNFMTVCAMTSVAMPSVCAADDLGEPAITLKSDAFKEIGAANSFHMLISSTEPAYFDIDMGNGPFEVEVEPATIVDGAWEGTFVSCHVNESGEIKIYGDPSKIDVFNCEGGYITDIDLSKCTNLEFLNLSHNALKGLDLTPNANLLAVYLTDNPGTPETPIKVGGPKNMLSILEVDIIDHLDPGFDLTQYPNLVSFDAYHTPSLKSVDLSNSKKLQTISLEMTSVESVDFSKCPLLGHVNVSETRLTSLDVSMLTHLQRLLCTHTSGSINTDIKLNALDLTHNPDLFYLAAQGNNLTSIDLTKNPELTNLFLQDNNLSELDLSNQNNLASVNITNNWFTFSTLPANDPKWTEYFYSQRPYPVEKVVAKGTEMKFPKMIRPGSTTYARLIRKPVGANTEAIEDEDALTFSADGTLVINKTFTDSVYVEFANTEFAEYSLTTTPFMVKEASEVGKPSPIISFGVTSRSTPYTFMIGLDGATAASPRKLMVDFGDGNLQEFNITSTEATSVVTGTPKGFTITIYAPEGDVITALAMDGQRLSSIDLTKATELRTLSLNDCNLAVIDLAYNRCLKSLNLDDNNLSALELQGVNGEYEKNVLTDIKAAGNKIKTSHIISTRSARSIDLSDNLLTQFDLENYDNLENLNLSGNQLTNVNIAYLSNARNVDFSDNRITEIESVIALPLCEKFDISGNDLTLGTLPYFTDGEPANYIYAPQAQLVIPAKAPGINLSKQNRVIDGKGTHYTWKTTEGQTLVEGTDYRITDDGATRFLNTSLGEIYCEMTNPAFPAFAGANVFRTSNVTPMGAPNTLVATFTTPEAVANGEISLATSGVDALYIDWRGDDTDFVPYETKETYTLYSGIETYAGAKVKVYTYNSPDNVTVFSISNIPMGEFDGSYMKKAFTFTLDGTGLTKDKIVFPEKSVISELNLDYAAFETIDLSEFPVLRSISMSGNNLTSVDLTKAPSLELASFADNHISEVKINNPKLWHLDLTMNELADINLSGLPAMNQIGLSHNNLSAIDLEPVKSTLRVLSITNNKFTFATLPVPADYPGITSYFYGNQADLEGEIVDLKVDYSSQAEAGGAQTVYRWFLDGFEIDAATGEAVGEELIADDEYFVNDGVTTFTTSYEKPVQALLTNEAFPNLYLKSPLLYFPTAIQAVEADGGDVNAPVEVYNLQGILVRSGVLPAEALDGLAPGIYIVAGKKVLKR